MQDLNEGLGYIPSEEIQLAIQSLQQQHRQLEASLHSTGSHNSGLLPSLHNSGHLPNPTPTPLTPILTQTPTPTSSLNPAPNPVQKQPPAVYRSLHQAIIDAYFKENSLEYRALETAKSCGWESGNLDNIFNKFKAKATQNIRQKDTSEMRTIMQAVMCEIDKASGNIISSGETTQFLDVCSGPGGFAEYVLNKAPNAVGMGVTLPFEEGGHPMGIENSRRFWCYYQDIMNKPKELLFCPPYVREPFVPPAYGGEGQTGTFQTRNCYPQANVCSLVILDGHYLSGTDRSNPTEKGSDDKSVSKLSASHNSLSGPLPPPPGFPTPLAQMSESSPLPELNEINSLLRSIHQSELDLSSVNNRDNNSDRRIGGGTLVPLQQSAQSELQLQLGALDTLPPLNRVTNNGSILTGSSLYDFPSGDLPSIPSAVLPAYQPQLLSQISGIVGSQSVSQVLSEQAQRNPEEVAFEVIKTQNLLWVSQLLIAVQNLADGGTLIMRSSTKPDFYLCIVTCMMTKVFRGEAKPVKPTVSHMMRSSFYVVYNDFDLQAAKNVGLADVLFKMFTDLQAAQQGDSMWPVIEGMSEFRDPRAFVESWGPSLLSFMSPLWRFQTLALTAMVHDQGSGRVMGMTNKTKMCFYHVLGQCKRIPEQCWYAHDIEQLTFLLREACKTRYMPLTAPWSPLNLPTEIMEVIKKLNIQDNKKAQQIINTLLQAQQDTNNNANSHTSSTQQINSPVFPK